MPKLIFLNKLSNAKMNVNVKSRALLVLCMILVAFKAAPPKKEFKGLKKVVIDAGHGGHDTGCLGSFSREKDVALAIALKLGEYIQKNFPDVEVIFTRDKDVFIGLDERAKIANSKQADLFICIHANSGSPAAYGSETYVMGQHKSEANLNVAKRENASILLEEDYELKYDGFDPNSPESYIALYLMQSAFLNQSLNFASKVQEQFRKLGRRDRGVKQAGFLVLYKTTMPSVLIETGFLTNKEEEKFLNDKANQEKMAGAIFTAFKEYKNELDKITQAALNEEEKKEHSEKKEGHQNPELYTYSHKENQPEAKQQNSPAKNKESEKGIVFRVQVLSSSNMLEINKKNFKGLEPVYEYMMNGRYKYAVGNETSYEKALKLQEEVKKKGFKDAFLIAFKDGKRISVKEAKELLNED
ncbi:MAG: N-acetylmuramoyl-L-alanine amidase [Bacteroidetes bacterium]|nr:MAG: N-acetylmuramoyl-L-alanine amidase [Bacteroidota bacterium]